MWVRFGFTNRNAVSFKPMWERIFLFVYTHNTKYQYGYFFIMGFNKCENNWKKMLFHFNSCVLTSDDIPVVTPRVTAGWVMCYWTAKNVTLKKTDWLTLICYQHVVNVEMLSCEVRGFCFLFLFFFFSGPGFLSIQSNKLCSNVAEVVKKKPEAS